MLLTLLPSVPIWIESNKLIFDRKFYDGVVKYCSLWPGNVRCVMRQGNQEPPKFGLVTLYKEELPFEIQVVESCNNITESHLADSNTVLASGDNHELLHISYLCKQKSIRCIYIIEYTLKTRLQIVALDAPTILHRIKRSIFTLYQERRRSKAFSLANGIQANGVPSFDSYKSEKKDDLLYFDNRVKPSEIITDAQLGDRLNHLELKKPLRLAFSGRLIKIKGADDLINVAQLLSHAGVDFIFSIYGTGDLDTYMQNQIIQKKLTEKVFLKGSVDFHSALLPALKVHTDLFVCLHKQGDPSCTYIETLSCGLPIVGYDNQAFIGILSKKDIGWSAPINDTKAIARIIGLLDNDRHLIAKKAQNSIEIAKENDFETTFTRRINHLAGKKEKPNN